MFKRGGSRSIQHHESQYNRTRRRKAIREADREQRRIQREERERARDEQGGTVEHQETLGDTAAERFVARQHRFAARFGRAGGLLHAGAWWTHNCVAHPLLGVAPGRLTLRLHDRTADWLNLSAEPSRSAPPQIASRRAWMLHNCVAHPLMGVLPRLRTFDLHETTAEEMDVPGWV